MGRESRDAGIDSDGTGSIHDCGVSSVFGRAGCTWYAQQDISTFTTFQELVDKFQELFQVKINPTEVLKESYSLQQEAGESIAEFLLWFCAVQAMLDMPPTEDI
jgi:hypothetical protein